MVTVAIGELDVARGRISRANKAIDFCAVNNANVRFAFAIGHLNQTIDLSIVFQNRFVVTSTYHSVPQLVSHESRVRQCQLTRRATVLIQS